MNLTLNSKLNSAIYTLLFIFPPLALTVKDAGSTIFVFLFIFSAPSLIRSWKKINTTEKNLVVWFVVFFLVMILGVFNSEDTREAIRRLEPYSRILSIPFLYLGFIDAGDRAVSTFLKGALLGSVIVFVTSIYQVFFNGDGSASGAYHHIIFGEFSVVMAFIIIARLFEIDVDRRGKFLLIFSAILYLISAILSTARGAWLALPFGIFVIAIITHRALSKKTLLKIVAGTLVVVVATGFLPKVQERFQAAGSDMKLYLENPEKGSSIGDRLNMWRDALLMFKSSPILGVGTGDFKYETGKLITEKKSDRTTNAYDHAHSIYFDTLATSGIIGLLVLLTALFLLPLKYFLEKIFRNEAGFAPIAGMLIVTCYIIFGLTETWIVRNPEANVFAVSMALFLAASRGHEKSEPIHP